MEEMWRATAGGSCKLARDAAVSLRCRWMRGCADACANVDQDKSWPVPTICSDTAMQRGTNAAGQ
jgi:hypothetical protein